MSKELDEIKKVIIPFQRNIETIAKAAQVASEAEIQSRKKTLLDQIKTDKEILSKSGVIKLFQEIRDSGLIKLSNEPVLEGVAVYKNKIFGGQILDHYERKQVCPYTPAIISLRRNSIRMEFDAKKCSIQGEEGIRYSAITIEVIDGKLNLVGGKENPIENGQLASTIAEAIKNPQREEDRDFYYNRSIGSQMENYERI